jgi:hypothetical protein
MNNSNYAPMGMAVTPHHLASESALSILRAGGNAIEATVAAAATLSVVYPHMNGLGRKANRSPSMPAVRPVRWPIGHFTRARRPFPIAAQNRP